MSGNLSNFGESLLLQWGFTTGAVTRPTTWFVALFTTAPTNAGGGVEVSGGSYARQSVGWTVTGSNPTQIANSSAATFPAATTAEGTVTAIGIFDAASGGNMWAYGSLNDINGNPSPLNVNIGDIVQFNGGGIVMTLE